ncbi:MAG: hypothetical protein PHY88_00680 [Candidatus Omnitrophica bacterium]|nr:hypothetical protein [Candidatus Omnitrophota bacterium]
MKKILLGGFISLVLILGFGKLGYGAGLNIEEVADNFYKATDLQRDQILKDNLGKEISADAKVTNAGEYDFFDTNSDVKGTYYQITTEPQKTKNNVTYQIIFLFKDKNKAKDIDKGQKVQKDGQIIRILDERLQISVWIFCGELTDKDKALFNQD